MELIQGVLVRVRTEGQKEAEALLSTLDRTGKAGTTAGQGLGQASAGMKATGAAARDASGGLGTMQGQLQKIASWVLPAGIVAGLTLIGKRAIDTADQMAQMSKRTGVSVEDLSRLSYAAKLADTNMGAVSVSFRAMSRAVDEAAGGNKELRASFAQVGISLEDIRTKNPTELFLAIANGIAGIEDPTTRAAKAQELMGRSAQELLPLMQDLAGDGFAKVSAEAAAMGQVISTNTAKAAEEFNDNLDRLKAGMQGGANVIVATLLPALNELGRALVGSVSDGTLRFLSPLNLVSLAVKGLSGLVIILTGEFRKMTAAAGAALDGLSQAWDRLKARDFRGAWGAVTGIGANADGLIAAEQARVEASLNRVFNPTSSSAGAVAATARTIATETDKTAHSMERTERAASGVARHLRGITDDIPYILESVDPAINAATLEMMRQRDAARSVGHTLYMVDPAINAATLRKAQEDAAIVAEAQARALEDRYRSSQFVGVLTDAFTDAAMTGGKNFGQIAGQITGDVVAFAIGSLLEKLVGGNPATWKLGDAAQGQDPRRLYDKSGKLVGPGASFGWAAVQGGAALYDIYGGVAAGGSRTAGTIQGGMAGAGIGMQLGSVVPGIGTLVGGVVGAVVGLIAGAITSALARQEAQSNYKYGVPQFNRGVASLNGTRNINPAEEQQMVAQLQDVFTSTWNQFVRVMLTLPGGQMPGMPPSMGGAFQPEASQNFMKHFNEYLQNTLPREIAELFKEGMEDAFVGSGVTAEAFQQFWREAEGLDAATRGQFWMDLAEGLAAISRAQANMGAVHGQWTDDPMFGRLRSGQFQFAGGRAIEGNESEFTANTRLAGENMFRIAREMVNLTGPERVAAFKALGQSIEQVTLSLQAYIEQIGETIRNLARTFANERMEMAYSRAGTNTERAGVLWSQYQANLTAIGTATDPAEIERLTNANIALLRRIYEIDPSAEMYAWWQRQLRALEDTSRTALERIAEDAVSQVDALLASVQPFVNWMMGLPVDMQPAWDSLDEGIRGAADALRDLERAIRDATKPPGGGNGGNNGNVPEDPNQNPVTITVQMNGSYTDRAALKRDVVSAVREALAVNPDAFDGAY